MKAYLQIEELWDTIEAPVNGSLLTDPAKMIRAKAKIILAVEPHIYPHIEGAASPKVAWQQLEKTCDDKGLQRKKLSGIGTKLPDDLVGALLLAGLPQDYKPMIMALGSSGTDITTDLVKTKLLEVTCSEQSDGYETRGLMVHSRSSEH
ncbi:uncharacterized protein LOC114882253 [Osmia bicornis bicornis]|uniref:uncharacterized protein LOC114882253 n=1 Tax=Osmia bicornis bicornis TaxID=1437191 RepID=UPI001EAF5580|nr:uncharacterized protein LOC114882253 [Osmia bicornis bicornis]